MDIEVLLVQLLVLAFTGLVWWLARRDLTSRPAPLVPDGALTDARELEQLCVTLEALVTDLAARIEAVEQRLQENVGAGVSPAAPSSVLMPSSTTLSLPPPSVAPFPEVAPPGVAPATVSAPALMPSFAASTLLPSPPALPQESTGPESAAHAPLYALLEAGITDPAEITRRTGLGRGEVDLILSLRARRAL